MSVAMNVTTAFFTSHYVFRWRTAMNDFYLSKWDKLRHIEGASQRVQEDTMRFASIVEGLGVVLINSVMTLVVFLPLLFEISKFPGTYTKLDASVALGGGVGGLQMKNENGVIMRLESRTQGLQFNLGMSGVTVTMEK